MPSLCFPPTVLLALALAFVVACPASAGVTSPQLTVQVTVQGDAPQSVSSTSGVPDGGGAYTYVGGVASSPGGGWSVDWILTGNDTSVLPGSPSITNDFAITNTGDATRIFQILVTFASPVQVTPGPETLFWVTLISGTLTSLDGGLSSLAGNEPSLIEGQINGSAVALNNPAFPSTTTVSSSGGSINTYGGPVPGGPDVATIGYLMSFSLSGRSAATFTGSWSGTVVPAPGGAAAFVLAGFVGLVRRRRS